MACLAMIVMTLVVVEDDGAAAPSATFLATVPSRVLDTRPGFTTVDGVAAGGGIRVAGSVTTLRIAGRAGVPAEAAAGALNITVTEPTTAGFVTVFSCGTVPATSSVNFVAGQTISNSAIVSFDATGQVCLFSSTSTHLVVDVTGAFPVGAFSGTGPHRLMDTRVGFTTVDGQFAGGGVRSFDTVTELQVTGRGGVPVDAAAVALNITATGPGSDGYVTVYPCGNRPLASTLNHQRGQTIANSALAQLSASGRVCLFTFSATHLVVDVTGFVPGGTDYHPLVPARLVDTRLDGITSDGRCDGTGRPRGGSVSTVSVLGRGGVPLGGVGAVVLNVTATDPGAAGFITAFTPASSVPTVSTVNFDDGGTVANGIVAPVDATGRIALYVNTGVHVVVDVVGWFPGTASASEPAECSGSYVAPRSDLQALSVNGTQACAVKIDGTVWCWSVNGGIDSLSPPVEVPGLTSAVEVDRGIDTCVRRSNGSVACRRSQFAPPGFVIDEVALPAAAADISVSWLLDCALTSAAQVLCWSGGSAPSLIAGITDPVELLAASSIGTFPQLGVAPINRVIVRTATGVATITMPEAGGAYEVAHLAQAAPGVPWSEVIASRFSPVDPLNSSCLVLVGGRATCENSGDLAGGTEVVQNTGLYLIAGNGNLRAIDRSASGVATGTTLSMRIRDVIGLDHSARVPQMMICGLTAQGDVMCWTNVIDPTVRQVLTEVLVA
jgi:hypothetical protein